MNKGIPFIKIADHVDVDFHLKGKRVGGSPLSPNVIPDRNSITMCALPFSS
jgi:hypothetical protein